MSVDEIAPVQVGAFNRRPLFRIQSGSLTITDADKDQNDTFNTNLGAINVSMAMVIHRIQIQCNIQGAFPNANSLYLLVGVLSENTGATSAVTEGGDTRSLFLYERDFERNLVTSGGSFQAYEALQTFNLNPWPIWTIAQTLNFLGEGVEAISGAYPNVIMRAHLWYTLEPVDAALRARLIERLNLAL